MLRIDMPMPPGCLTCPCSHVIRTGTRAGESMCAALEWKDMRQAEEPLSFREEWLVDLAAWGRPEKCPMEEETEKGPSERQP